MVMIRHFPDPTTRANTRRCWFTVNLQRPASILAREARLPTLGKRLRRILASNYLPERLFLKIYDLSFMYLISPTLIFDNALFICGTNGKRSFISFVGATI